MKINKKLMSFVSIFMAVLMVFVNLSLPVGALDSTIDADATVQMPTNPEDKIDPVLKEKMETASPD